MTDAVSTILVRILGDAKGLTTALGVADGGLRGTATKIAGGIIALGAVKKGFDALGDSLQEADRLGDATSRLELQLGDLADPLEDAAGGFAKLGLSSQDVLELSANFADLATKAGIADPVIAANAEHVAAIAAAASLLGDQDPSTIVDEIGKAAGGSKKPLADLGVVLDDAAVTAQALADTGKSSAKSLTDNELAAARLKLIMEQLDPKIAAVTGANADLESGQRELGARIETLEGQLGEKLAPALETVLQFTNDEIDAIPHAIAGFQLLDDAIGRFGQQSLGGLIKVKDLLDDIIAALQVVTGLGSAGPGGGANGSAGKALGIARSEHQTVADTIDFDERNGGARAVNSRIGGP